MIHFTCDLCGRKMLQSENHYRLYIDIEPCPAEDFELEEYLEDDDLPGEREADFTEMIEAELAGADDCHHFGFDLCEACKKEYVADPLKKIASVRRVKTGYSIN